MWKWLNSVLNYKANQNSVNKLKLNGIKVSGKQLADSFNNYFLNAIQTQMLNNNFSNVPHNVNSIFHEPVSKAEVIEVIRNLKK